MDATEQQYVPPRQPTPTATGQPIEVDLVYNVIACGTCEFFWPATPGQQAYGPYPAFDLSLADPPQPDPDPATASFAWAEGTTVEAAFPLPELLDGCRKAPIMTIGINPNLTAFAPGQTGTSWCYPSFRSDASADLWTKYAYYYRYRSVFQERFDFSWIQQFLLPEPRIMATKSGSVVSALRPTDAPTFDLHVRYDGDAVDTVYTCAHEPGTPRWVLLFDSHGATSRFAAGQVLAGRLDVPGGQSASIVREQVGYYMQFVPVLQAFEATVRASGHPQATLRMGEDVCQLDMVASASPHWTPDFLGGSSGSERTIVDNCVSKNAYAIKQLVQTRPAVLFLVGEATYHMFADAFGALLHGDPPLPAAPADQAFTLLKATTSTPCLLTFDTTVDDVAYHLETRVVVTPHFSYSTNFTPQIRLSPQDWASLQQSDPDCASALKGDAALVYQPPLEAYDFAAFLIPDGAAAKLADLTARFPHSAAVLTAGFYDPHAMMAGVLDELYAAGSITYDAAGGTGSVLARTEGPCQFCVNDRWVLPGGCAYDKPKEPQPPPGFLESVAEELVSAGRPTPTHA